MKNGPYELVIAPGDYPGKKYRGKYCYAHRLNFWKTYGYLPENKQLIIHHIDGNKLNNSSDNLKLMDIKDHNTLRHLNPYEDKIMSCPQCGNTFLWTADQQKNFYRMQQNHNYKHQCGPFCSKRCAGIWGKLIQSGCNMDN